MNIVSGEKLQNLCDYYLGTHDQFNYNPFIQSQTLTSFVTNCA